MKPLLPNKPDRRKKRTQQMLEDALIVLIEERGYDSLTVEDITEYANVGRTTFYLHYNNKEDLLINMIKKRIAHFSFGMKSADDWLGEQATPQLVNFFKEIKQRDAVQNRLNGLRRGNRIILYAMNHLISQQMEDNLRTAFFENSFTLPLPLLAHSMAGTHTWLVDWWVEKNPPYSAEEMAGTDRSF